METPSQDPGQLLVGLLVSLFVIDDDVTAEDLLTVTMLHKDSHNCDHIFLPYVLGTYLVTPLSPVVSRF